MLGDLSQKLEQIFKKLRGKGVLNEQDIAEALRGIKLTLLEADVRYKVVKEFLDRVQAKALGQEVMGSLTPGQQVVKVVFDELSQLMGEKQSPLRLSSSPPTVWMLVGLQGSGKTTTSGKLAKFFLKENRKILLVAADTRRPAAVEQLKALGRQLDVEVYQPTGGFPIDGEVAICKEAVEFAKSGYYDLVILDTAGRLHVDDDLMANLRQIKDAVHPDEVLLVADAMTGQDAVKMAERFDQQIGLDGVILTKMEGDARGGAVLSIKAVTGKPVKFVGVGEKLDALEPFHPDRVASRILGMGDVLSLIEQAKEVFKENQAEELEKKLRSDSFTLEDFQEQLRQVKRLGSFDHLLEMIPGGERLKGMMVNDQPEKEMKRAEAIVSSMTIVERRNPMLINGSRRKRIAKGSGTTVENVNRLLKQFLEAKKMMKAFSGKRTRLPIGGLFKAFKGPRG
jgi:signal recognition particle subunit SRP54